MQDRRKFLKKTATVTTAASGVLPALMGTSCKNSGAPEHAPAPLKSRRRRIIWNNDGTDLEAVAHSHLKKSRWPSRYGSVDEFLEKRMKGKLEGTHVDSLFYNGHTDYPNWEFPSRNLEALGPDPLKHVVDFAHQNGMEFMYSIRMNEIHCAVLPGITRWSSFKREHLHLLQGKLSREDLDQRVLPWARGETEATPLAEGLKQLWGAGRDFYSWAAYNYAYPEVQDYFLRVVEGACERYDLDGIELDWGRFPYLFKFGEERRNVPVMTDFVRQVRQRLQAYGRKRGRPILLVMRLPDSPSLSLSIGLDAESWMGEGWLDVLIAGFGFAPFSFPLADWVRLGHQYGIPVYGCIDHLVPVTNKLEAIRGAASHYWEEGADGIYLYNYFEDPIFSTPAESLDASLHEVGDPKQLERLDKLYQIDPDAQASMLAEFGARWRGWGGFYVGSWSGQLPLAFTTRSGPATARLRLKISDRPETASRVTVQTQWQPEVDAERVAWEVNGQPLLNPKAFSPEGETQQGWIELETQALRKGVNTFGVTVQPPREGDPAKPVVLQQVRVSIRYS